MKAALPAGARRLLLALGMAWSATFPVQAGMRLLGQAELAEALGSEAPCCVIDARSDASRRKHPLADALRYRPDLSIKVSAAVVVVADRDQDAARVGAALARKYPGKTVHAVKGGVTAWEAVLQSLNAGAAGKGTPFPFVIPRNTCETGTPVQIFNDKTKP